MMNARHNPGRSYVSIEDRRSQRTVGVPGGAAAGVTTISGIFGFLGLLMGLLATFALIAAAVDWRNEAAQAQWPLVSAVIERGEVTAFWRAQSNGDTRRWKLDYRVRFDLNGQKQIASISLPSATSESQERELQSWAARHRRGEKIDVRYDPSRPSRAIFASDSAPNGGSRTHSDLVLVVIFALAAVGLIALARHLALGESREMAGTNTGNPSRSGRIALGVISAQIGLVVFGTAIGAVMHAADRFTSDAFIAIPVSLIFVFGGVLLATGPGNARWRGMLSTLLVTCLAAAFDWAAFGPGEREFGGGITLGPHVGAGVPVGEFVGRAAFGVAAIVLDVFAILAWIRHWTRKPQSQRDL